MNEAEDINVKSSALRGAVFLSYASQDAAAAGRICEGLRGAGVEVWFDKSELVGGDAWDAKIRKQIRDCALFIPIVSATTQARTEGYFRLEWHLADQRTQLMAKERPFLLPVTIDQTSDRDALVPDSFTAVQWTTLPGGETSPAFAARVKKLLDAEFVGAALSRGGLDESRPKAAPTAMPAGEPTRRRVRPVLAGIALVIIALGVTLILQLGRKSAGVHETSAAQGAPAKPDSAARQLARRAQALIAQPAPLRETLESAVQLIEQAKLLDPSDADIWAIGAEADTWAVFYQYDTTQARKQRAQSAAARALSLDPASFEARLARTFVLMTVIAQPGVYPEAETLLHELLSEKPEEPRALELLGELLRSEGRNGEAAAIFQRAKSFNAAGWAYFFAGNFDAATAMADRALQTDHTVANLELKAQVELAGHEDLDATQLALDQLPASALLEDHPASFTVFSRMMRREPEKMLEILRAIPRDWLSSSEYIGPKAYLTGLAHRLADRPQAAEADWHTALQVVEQRLASQPNAPDLLLWKALLLAELGEHTEAARLLDLEAQLAAPDANDIQRGLKRTETSILLGRRGYALDLLEGELKKHSMPFWHATARFDPMYDPLRGDPRFEKLLRDYLPNGAKPFDQPKPTAAAAASNEKPLAVL